MTDWQKVGQTLLFAGLFGTIGYFYNQEKLVQDDKDKATQYKFKAPAQLKKPEHLGEKKPIKETEQRQIPGIPPAGVKGLGEFGPIEHKPSLMQRAVWHHLKGKALKLYEKEMSNFDRSTLRLILQRLEEEYYKDGDEQALESDLETIGERITAAD